MNYSQLIFWKTIKRTIHILVGIIIGFWLTCQFRSINYKNFKKDIFYQLCSYKSLSYLHENDVFYVSTKKDLARTFDSIRNITSKRQSDRKLLLVGVMTAKSFLETRASTIYDTWGRDLIGDIIFFTSSNLSTNTNLPYVALPQVDDSYPPQKKSFLMLKFMHDYFGDRYKFFMRADDDVFVNVGKLRRFLESLNSSDLIYIGQTGVGNKEEFGLLNLNFHDNFCMGGPGVIISFKALAKIADNVHNCLNNLYSTHEDVEVGRCLRKYARISCTWSYDMQNLFYHNTSIQSHILNDIPPSKDLLNALTIHSIKNPIAMKALYLYFKSIDHQSLSFKITKFLRWLANNIFTLKFDLNFLSNIKTLANIKKLSDGADTIGFSPSLKVLFSRSSPNSVWKYFSQKFFTELSLNPRKNIEKDIIQAFNKNMRQIMISLNRNFFKKGTLFDYHSLHYGYVKFDPLLGTQYILDFLMIYRKYQGKRLTIPIRKHIHAVQTFSYSRVIKQKTDIEIPVVNVIVPLAGRLSIFKRFVKNFVEVWRQDHRVTLTIVLFPDQDKDQTVNEIENILNHTNIDQKANILKINGKFSRGNALQKSSSFFSDDSLLFFLDVDMLFTSKVLHRIRQNTIRGEQVYFPIVFSQYKNFLKRRTNSLTGQSDQFIKIDDNNGYWRQFGYGIVSLYKQDLDSVGGYNTTINGWGMEDVNLYDRYISSNLTIFRAVDPDLIHVYHDIHCDKQLSLTQYEMCLGTKFFSLDSIDTISKFIKSHRFLSN